MENPEFRFTISAEKYLDKHSILVYIEDAVSQLLEHRDDNPKVNTSKFLSEYFVSVREGNHTLFREFAFIQATAHNRRSFVKTVWKCFRNIGRKGDLLSVREYHSLLCLLCSDFPIAPVQKTAKIILLDDAQDSLISFSDFLYAFQVQFCFDEFLAKCQDVYRELELTKQNPHDPVVVPTSEEATPRVHEDQASGRPEGVDTIAFLRALHPLIENLGFLAPSEAVLRDILSNKERVTYYGFLMALAKSDRLNVCIGNLPNRADLLDTTEKELTSMELLLNRCTYRAHNATDPPLIPPTPSARTQKPSTTSSSSRRRPNSAAPSSAEPPNSAASNVTSQPGSGKSRPPSASRSAGGTGSNSAASLGPLKTGNTSVVTTGSAVSSVGGMVAGSGAAGAGKGGVVGMKSQRLASKLSRAALVSSSDDETDDSDSTN